MKTKDELVADLLKAIETSDSVCGDHILVPKADAIRIVQLLSGVTTAQPASENTTGRILFYCTNCSKSFHANGREDRECFENYHYHRWYAKCPWCEQEVSQNDRYWR